MPCSGCCSSGVEETERCQHQGPEMRTGRRADWKRAVRSESGGGSSPLQPTALPGRGCSEAANCGLPDQALRSSASIFLKGKTCCAPLYRCVEESGRQCDVAMGTGDWGGVEGRSAVGKAGRWWEREKGDARKIASCSKPLYTTASTGGVSPESITVPVSGTYLEFVGQFKVKPHHSGRVHPTQPPSRQDASARRLLRLPAHVTRLQLRRPEYSHDFFNTV